MSAPHCRCDAALALADAAQDVLETGPDGQQTAIQHLSDALQVFGMAYAIQVDCCPLGIDRRAGQCIHLKNLPPEKMESASRFSDALELITPGACSPSGIALAIAHACRQVRSEGGAPSSDPAVRLMAGQLAWVCQADAVLAQMPSLIMECQRRLDEAAKDTAPLRH